MTQVNFFWQITFGRVACLHCRKQKLLSRELNQYGVKDDTTKCCTTILNMYCCTTASLRGLFKKSKYFSSRKFNIHGSCHMEIGRNFSEQKVTGIALVEEILNYNGSIGKTLRYDQPPFSDATEPLLIH